MGSAGLQWDIADVIASSRMNRKSRFVGTGAQFAGLSTIYAGQEFYCTSTGSGYTADHLYEVAADGVTVNDISILVPIATDITVYPYDNTESDYSFPTSVTYPTPITYGTVYATNLVGVGLTSGITNGAKAYDHDFTTASDENQDLLDIGSPSAVYIYWDLGQLYNCTQVRAKINSNHNGASNGWNMYGRNSSGTWVSLDTDPNRGSPGSYLTDRTTSLSAAYDRFAFTRTGSNGYVHLTFYELTVTATSTYSPVGFSTGTPIQPNSFNQVGTFSVTSGSNANDGNYSTATGQNTGGQDAAGAPSANYCYWDLVRPKRVQAIHYKINMVNSATNGFRFYGRDQTGTWQLLATPHSGVAAGNNTYDEVVTVTDGEYDRIALVGDVASGTNEFTIYELQYVIATYTAAVNMAYVATCSGSANLEFAAVEVYLNSSTTTATSIQIHVSPDNSTWTAVRYENISLIGDQQHYLRFNRPSATMRYFRVQSGDAGAVILDIAYVKYLAPTESQWNRRHGHKLITPTVLTYPENY